MSSLAHMHVHGELAVLKKCPWSIFNLDEISRTSWTERWRQYVFFQMSVFPITLWRNVVCQTSGIENYELIYIYIYISYNYVIRMDWSICKPSQFWFLYFFCWFSAFLKFKKFRQYHQIQLTSTDIRVSHAHLSFTFSYLFRSFRPSSGISFWHNRKVLMTSAFF
jgi:hypothetical protein